MKTDKKALITQRSMMDQKLQSWNIIRSDRTPPSGWIKAVRGSLGMTSQQLASRMGLDHSGVLRLEKRESEGKATLESIEKAAHAMNCKLVYAIVPDDHHQTLEEILVNQARKVAKDISKRVEHSMRLEKQGVHKEATEQQIEKIAEELKAKMDSMIWEKGKK